MGFLPPKNQTNGSLLQEGKLQPICIDSVQAPRPSPEESQELLARSKKLLQYGSTAQ